MGAVMVLRLLSWNLQGSHGVDVPAVAAVIAAARPDVVALQEVQRRQSVRLARALGMAHRSWAFKHWPVWTRPEGLAVLAHRPMRTDAFVLHRGWWWSWRRRVGLDVTMSLPGRTMRFMNVHLSPHDADERRSREIELVIARAGSPPPIIVGDFNDRPGGPALATLMAAGWRDAWIESHPTQAAEAVESRDDLVDPGATNWTAGDRRGRAPTQRLDIVFVPPEWHVDTTEVIDEPIDDLARLSDHVPVLAVLR